MLKTFVCFYLPDNEIYEYEIKVRVISLVAIPPNAYAYQFYDKQVIQAEDGELCYGSKRDESPITYIDSQVFSISDLEAIISEMKENSYESVIFTPCREIYNQVGDEEFITRAKLASMP